MRECPKQLEKENDTPFLKSSLIWDDKLYCTEDLNYVSTQKFNDDFMSFLERFESKYGPGGYILDEFKRIRPGPTTKTVDFGHLMDILKSDNEALLVENAWIFEGDSKYLNMKDPESGKTVESTGNIVSYCSFPRCGNSFLRKYFQMVTGIATGSDMTLEFCVDL